MQKDFSHQPDKQILSWLLQCWDFGASRQELEGKEAQQMGSLASNKAIDIGTGEEVGDFSHWRWHLWSVKDRYHFKEDLANSQSKWTTTEGGIQYLRELVVLEVIYSNLDDNQASKDPDEIWCTRSMW